MPLLGILHRSDTRSGWSFSPKPVLGIARNCEYSVTFLIKLTGPIQAISLAHQKSATTWGQLKCLMTQLLHSERQQKMFNTWEEISYFGILVPVSSSIPSSLSRFTNILQQWASEAVYLKTKESTQYQTHLSSPPEACLRPSSVTCIQIVQINLQLYVKIKLAN